MPFLYEVTHIFLQECYLLIISWWFTDAISRYTIHTLNRREEMDGWMNQREKEEGYYNLSNIFLVISISYRLKSGMYVRWAKRAWLRWWWYKQSDVIGSKETTFGSVLGSKAFQFPIFFQFSFVCWCWLTWYQNHPKKAK